jgi:hypothetical protein
VKILSDLPLGLTFRANKSNFKVVNTQKMSGVMLFRKSRRIGWLLGALLVLGGEGRTQWLDNKQFPPDIHWCQIKTPNYQIIFPAEFTKEAQRVANTIEYLQRPLHFSLSAQPTRWPLLLNNRSALGNGYVSLAPRRSEWYATPSINSFTGCTEWFNLLAVHEGRHMVQFQATNQGFTRWSYYLFGELGQAALAILATPAWFWEGDAVVTETALTNSGRGRLPEFNKEIRAQLLSGQEYSYAKAFLGSYRDYAGDYYRLGYLLVGEARLRYGPNFWNEVIQRSAQRSYNPFAFSRALKATTGWNATHFYRHMLNSWRRRWQAQQVRLDTTSCQLFRTENKCYTNYIFPHWSEEGRLISLKYGYGDIPTIVELRQSGQETVLTQLPNHEWLSIGAHKIAWHEYEVHPRWQAIVNAHIIIYDQQQRFRLTKTGNYLMPALSPDDRRVAAVKILSGGQCQLVILDAESGEEVALLDSSSSFWKYPSWSPDGRKLVCVRQEENALALTLYDWQNGFERDLILPGAENISYPRFYGDFVIYCSPQAGRDDIYAISLVDGQRYLVTRRPLGAFYPAIRDSILIFSDFSPAGYRIARQELIPSYWVPIEEVESCLSTVPDSLAAQEQYAPIDWKKIPNNAYPVEPYLPCQNLLNIHSWLLLPVPPSLILGLVSQDLLNTTALTSYIAFNSNERTFDFSTALQYGGWLPKISFELALGRRQQKSANSDMTTSDHWLEQRVRLTTEIILGRSDGVYNKQLAIGSGLNYTRINGKAGITNQNGAILPLTYWLQFARLKFQAPRDLQSPLGYDFRLDYGHTPVRMDFWGNFWSWRGKGYLPGGWRHHGITVGLAAERQWGGNYQYASQVAFPRGYKFVPTQKLIKGSLDYIFPLSYPEWALGEWFYLKRTHLGLFWDHGIASIHNNHRQYRSAGAELLGDFHLLSLPVEICSGVRCAYLIDEHRWHWEVVVYGMGL